MSKLYRITATFSYLCVAENEEDALEQFEMYCDFNHIRAGDFEDVYFDGIAREVPKEDE